MNWILILVLIWSVGSITWLVLSLFKGWEFGSYASFILFVISLMFGWGVMMSSIPIDSHVEKVLDYEYTQTKYELSVYRKGVKTLTFNTVYKMEDIKARIDANQGLYYSYDLNSYGSKMNELYIWSSENLETTEVKEN